MTKVVNVKVQYIRPQYSNLAEWMQDEQNVYIGRRGVVFIGGKRFPPENSVFANPYKINRDGSRDEVLEKYEEHVRSIIELNPDFKSRLLELKGKNLGCWCKSMTSCHGGVLIKLINEFDSA